MHYDIYVSSKIKRDPGELVNIAEQNDLNIEIKNFVWDRDFEKLNKELPLLKFVFMGFKGKLALHAAFERINPISENIEIRKKTAYRFNQSIEIAKSLNVKTIIFHTGIDTFRKEPDKNWFIEKQTEFWQEFIADNLAGTDIIAVLENTDEKTPTPLIEIARKVNSENLKLCIDAGHVNHKTNMSVEEWIIAEKNYLHHMHLHNNYKLFDDHNSLLKGTIDFKEVFRAIKENNLNPGLSLEITDFNAAMESLDFARKELEGSI